MIEDDRKIAVLFIQYDNNFAGSAQSLADLIESVKVKVRPLVLVSGKGQAYDYFIKQGIECYVHPFLMSYTRNKSLRQLIFHPWQIRPIAYLRKEIPCLYFIKQIVSSQNVDIIHSNCSTFDIGYKSAKVLNLKHVWHIREYFNTQHLGGEPIASLKKKINNSDAKVFISNCCKSDWNLTDTKTWMIWDAVRCSNDCCYDKVKDSYILFCASYITKAKGIVTAICAFGMSGLAEKGIRLKVVGFYDKDTLQSLLNLAKEYSCENAIDFLHFQSDVKHLFAKAQAFIQPSTNEGMGRTTVEAMFFGCPVIAYASGGTLDLVKDGETGYLFNTVEECAELMQKVCTTNQEGIILQAQSFAKNNFSIENYGKKIIEVYNKVLCKNF